MVSPERTISEYERLGNLISDLEKPFPDHTKKCNLRNLTVLLKGLAQRQFLTVLSELPTTPDELELWYRFHFRKSARLLISADLWVLEIERAFPKFAIAVAELSPISDSDGLTKWFWRCVFTDYPLWIQKPIEKRLQASPSDENFFEGGLEGYYQGQVNHELKAFTAFENLQNYELAQASINYACKAVDDDEKLLRNLLLEVFSDDKGFDCIVPELPLDDQSCVPDKLSVLDKAVRVLVARKIDDYEQLVHDLCNALLSIARPPTKLCEVYHPVSRVLCRASRSLLMDSPESISRWLEDQGELLSGESLTSVMSIYSREKYPWIKDYVAEYIDYYGYEAPKSLPTSSQAFEYSDTKETGVVFKSSHHIPYDHRRDIEPQWIPYKTCSAEQALSVIFDSNVAIEERVEEIGLLVRYSVNAMRAQGYFDEYFVVSEQVYLAVVSEFTSDKFEREVSPNIVLYNRYVNFCRPHISSDRHILMLDKCLGKLRRRLKDEKEPFKIGSEYLGVLEEFSSSGEHERILNSLLLVFRVAPSCRDNDAIRVHWDLKPFAVVEQSNNDIALNWFLAKWLPQQILQDEENEKGNLTSEAEERYKAENLRRLTETLSQFCIKSLEIRKNKGKKTKGPIITGAYKPEHCKEPNSHWRKAYLEALAELRLDAGGSAHKIADFVRNNDFDKDTRESARVAHNSLRKLKTYKTSRDIHRSYLAALWCLRIGRASADHTKIDHKQAGRWRSRELQRVQ